MINKNIINLKSVAIFCIERVKGEGYAITSSSGTHSLELGSFALALLDNIGQPDHNSVPDFCKSFEVITDRKYIVAVRINLLPNGESNFNQEWFFCDQTRRSIIFLSFIVGSFCLLSAGLFFAGIYFEKSFIEDKKQDDPSPIIIQKDDENWKNIRVIADDVDNQKMLKTLKNFLKQKGLTAKEGDIRKVSNNFPLHIKFSVTGKPRILNVDFDEYDARALLEILELIPCSSLEVISP